DLTSAGTPTAASGSIDEVESILLAESRAGDVVVTMSSGSFAGLAGRLVRGLTERGGRVSTPG
ncbi:MAG TPA: UDP-N-acetylmuramate:L-alanyl-gamma-D-glutamyl-meso-diaminopimelate ligase, partial [Thermoanaerobaculia bacterium]|nr:UDP-N-acetylmuramate:L-alanyl-gamma-D-glutamyl-meso-diaminopimelate ligase [Thermoanaerobaculia bacterium]